MAVAGIFSISTILVSMPSILILISILISIVSMFMINCKSTYYNAIFYDCTVRIFNIYQNLLESTVI
jgi:hypothetical protein